MLLPSRSSATVSICNREWFPHGVSKNPALAASDFISLVGSSSVMSTPMAARSRSMTPLKSRTAINLIRVRLRHSYGDAIKFDIVGEPTTVKDHNVETNSTEREGAGEARTGKER